MINHDIFGWDLAKNEIFFVKGPTENRGAPLLAGVPLLENLWYSTQNQTSNIEHHKYI